MLAHRAQCRFAEQVPEKRRRTVYHRLRGKSWNHEKVDFGEKVQQPHQSQGIDKRIQTRRSMGRGVRTGEYWIAKSGGICKASAIRRVGGHRRWDAEGLLQVKGVLCGSW